MKTMLVLRKVDNMKLKKLNETQDFSIWKVNKATLEDNVDTLDAALKKVAGDNKGGLVPDEIKSSDEYKEADSKFKKAFKELQDFNKASPKGFLSKASKEARAAKMKS